MGDQIFEIMLLFAVYSILGQLVAGCVSALGENRFRKERAWAGPYSPSFGAGTLAALYGADHVRETVLTVKMLEPVLYLGIGFAAGLLIMLAGRCLRSWGVRTLAAQWYFPLLTAFGAVICGIHLNGVLHAYILWMSPWVHLIFLLLFWPKLLSDIADELFRIGKGEKKKHFFKESE